MAYFDDLETRTADARAAAQIAALKSLLPPELASAIESLSDLPKLKIMRKSFGCEVWNSFRLKKSPRRWGGT